MGTKNPSFPVPEYTMAIIHTGMSYIDCGEAIKFKKMASVSLQGAICDQITNSQICPKIFS